MVRLMRSKSSSEISKPARRAMAITCTIAFVDPPTAMSTVMAFSNDSRESTSEGLRLAQAKSTARRPQEVDIRICSLTIAGMLEAPGRQNPNASAMAPIVEAVPIVMQWPGERPIAFSNFVQSSSQRLPAHRSAQNPHTELPLPSASLPQRAVDIGPQGR